MNDLITLGGAALAGKGFSTLTFLLKELSAARREANALAMEKFDKQESSMERAEKANGGVFMRRAIYFLPAFAFISIIIAGWFGQTIVIENEVTKGFWIFKREVIEYVSVQGVPLLAANKTAFLAIVSFYLGAKV